MPQYNSLVLSAQVQAPMQKPTGTNSQLLPLGGPCQQELEGKWLAPKMFR